MAHTAHQGLPPGRSAAVLQRDAALARVTRIRRATIVSAGALTAGLAYAVSAIAPGHTLGAKLTAHPAAATTTPRHSSTPKARMPPLAQPDQLGLQAPSSAPQAASAAPPQPAPSQPSPSQSAPAPAPAAPAPAVSGGS